MAPLTREDATEVFDIVAVLEGLAARLAAQMPPPQRNALAREMSALNTEFRKISQAQRPDHDRLYELDEKFHGAYVAAAAGARLKALHHAVKPQAERYERLYVSFLTGEIVTSTREHEDIVNAIQSGQPEKAEAAVHRNWHNAAERLSQVIERVGERGRW